MPRFYGKALLAGVALWTLPVVLFAPLRTGGMGYEGGLALLLASVINLHHFILDGAIWKLRSSRVASVLIRSTPVPDATPSRVTGWPRRAVWAACAVGLACWALVFGSIYFAHPSAAARGDLDARERILGRMEWLGHDNAKMRLDLARREASAGDIERAVRSFERALAFEPSWPGYQDLASLYESRGDSAGARRVYLEAEAALGGTRDLLLRRALLAYRQGDFDAAHEDAERVLERHPRDADVLVILARSPLARHTPRARSLVRARPGAAGACWRPLRARWGVATAPSPNAREQEALR